MTKNLMVQSKASKYSTAVSSMCDYKHGKPSHMKKFVDICYRFVHGKKPGGAGHFNQKNQ